MFHSIPPLFNGVRKDDGVSLAMGLVSTWLVVEILVAKQREYTRQGDPFGSRSRIRRKKID